MTQLATLVLLQQILPEETETENFIPILKKAKRLLLKLWRIVADKGYDGEKNLEFVQRKMRAEAVIPIKEGQSTPSRSKRRKMMLKLWNTEKAKELNLKYVVYNLHRLERLSKSFFTALVEVFYAAAPQNSPRISTAKRFYRSN